MEERSQEFIKKNMRLEQEIQAYQLTEETLWQSQHFIQRVAQTSASLLYIYDLIAKRNIYANSQVAATLGYTPLEFVQMEEDLTTSLVHPDDVATLTEHFKRFQDATDSESFEIEYRMKHKDGEWRWSEAGKLYLPEKLSGLPYQFWFG
jgi:PAS domain S-box-containing protein